MPKGDATAAQRERPVADGRKEAAFNGRGRTCVWPPPSTGSATKFHFGIAGYCRRGLKMTMWAVAAAFETTERKAAQSFLV